MPNIHMWMHCEKYGKQIQKIQEQKNTNKKDRHGKKQQKNNKSRKEPYLSI